MNVREKTEKIEALVLSPYALKSCAAKRQRQEIPCPFRAAYQRDRDRILHSKAFRRLKHKTQVYTAPGDHYRMRMTHSLEVAQIARTIARGLRLNEDAVEAMALGHDVGHTPFGHAGEQAMAEILGHFRHNEQSLRVVRFLEKGGEGLNLTEAVLDGILKHSGDAQPNTLEGKVVKFSDRIAYLCHDFDDSLRAGMLTVASLPEEVSRRFSKTPSQMITAMVSDLICSSMGKNEILQTKEVQTAMNSFRSFMFEKIYHSKALAEERKKAAYVIQTLYQYFYSHPAKLPPEYQSRAEVWNLETTVADYISGLTDRYAIQMFEQIFIPSLTVRL